MRTSLLTVAACLLAVPAFAASPKVVVPLKASNGSDVGTATLTQSGKNVAIKLALKDLPVGDHGVHIHEKAACDAPDFKTAGGHFNPDKKQHGNQNPMGHHNGDLGKNVTVGEDHTANVTIKVDYLSLNPTAPNSVFANGGTSIVIHEKPDDMKTDPTGNAGNRIACGIITAPTP
jgi:superoxide dismutase, Cu-Zn family